MKKLSFVALLAGFGLAGAQCTISGASTISTSEESSYRIESDNAQCPDCHLWTFVGNNIEIAGDAKGSAIKVKPVGAGSATLSLQMLTPQGLSQCSKSIVVGGDYTSSNTASSCDIQVNNFKEVKFDSSTVTFFPNDGANNYKYTWKAVYANGDTRESTEKVPQFPFTKEKSIQKVSVRITSLKCMKEFSKTYEENYWKYF